MGIAIILAIGAFLPGSEWRLLDLQPSPLWIVVLAVAVRYGGSYGYLAGGASAVAYGLLLWTRPETRFQPVASHELIQPFLMYVVGACLGELVAVRERRIADLETRHGEANDALKALWQRHQTSEKVRVELEKQIALQSNSTVALSTLGMKLQSLSVPDLHKAIVDLVSAFLEVDACSLYLYHEGQLSLAAGRPGDWPGRPEVISLRHRLISQAIGAGRVVTIRDRLVHEGCESIDGYSILMVGPLTLSSGDIYGIVSIESVPFIKFTPSAVNLLGMILEWASAALENALLYEQVRLKSDMIEELSGQASAWSLTPDRESLRLPQ